MLVAMRHRGYPIPSAADGTVRCLCERLWCGRSARKCEGNSETRNQQARALAQTVNEMRLA
jgi:hypothetical protein